MYSKIDNTDTALIMRNYYQLVRAALKITPIYWNRLSTFVSFIVSAALYDLCYYAVFAHQGN